MNEHQVYMQMRSKDAIRRKKAEGELMHLAPLGYKNGRDANGRSIAVLDPDTYLLIQEARRLREQGLSVRRICRAMNEKGLRTKRGQPLTSMVLWRCLNAVDPMFAPIRSVVTKSQKLDTLGSNQKISYGRNPSVQNHEHISNQFPG